MIERDQLIAEVARATGVRLDGSDPILAAAIIHETLLNEALVKLDRQVTIQADRVTAACTQAVVDAKKEAELLLTDAGGWVDHRMRMAAEAAAALMLDELRHETQAAQKARRAVLRMVWLMATFCLVALSGAGGVALASFR